MAGNTKARKPHLLPLTADECGFRLVGAVPPRRLVIHASPAGEERSVADSPFASASVKAHVIRGIVGLVALIAGVTIAAVVTPVGLLLLLVTPVAWRGCPTCWAVGLMATRERAAACPTPRRPPAAGR